MIVYTKKHKVPFQIDEADYESVSYYTWRIDRGYPTTTLGKQTLGRKRKCPLHQFLLGKAPAGYDTDHKNRDRLDNRRANLHHVTKRQNRCNRSDNKSGIVGVSRHTQSGRWVVQLNVGRKNRYFGLFATIEEAAAARLAAEREYLRGAT